MPYLNKSTLTLPATSAFPNGIWQDTRDPTSNDYRNFFIGTEWINFHNKTVWFMVDKTATSGTWVQAASGSLVTETLTGNTGGPVGVDGANNINVIGAGALTVTGNPGTHTLTISQSGVVATQYTEDGATIAIPSGGNLNVFGANGISTSGAGSTITITSTNGQLLTGLIPDAHTAPGTTPVVPNSSGNITVTGGQVAAGTTTNVIRTDSLAANTYTVEVQRSQAVASSTIGDNGVSHFSNAQFTVDGNGFVQLFGGADPAIQQINIQTFSSSGTYTPTTNMVYCQVTCLGSGGAGGGAVATGVNQFSVGGGGGGGEYSVGIFNAATIGASQAVTIGTGGTGVSGANGNNGGNSSLGALISSFGGSGGLASPLSTAGSFIGGGGAGGTGGAGGNYRTPGSPGLNGLAGATAIVAFGGTGASSQLGSGGLEVPGFGAGSNALGFGAGGNGADQGLGGGALAGGNGSSGIITILEYIS